MSQHKSKLLKSFSELTGYDTQDSVTGKVIDFPQNFLPARLAKVEDIKNIVELWANSALMRYFEDPVRWNWKSKASEVWSDYALDIIQDDNRFLVLCDMKDNGLSGFLIARIEELPNYYQSKYCLTVEDFYLRPKDKKPELFKQLLEILLKEAYSRKKLMQSNGDISMKIEVIESDESLTKLLIDAGFKKSSTTYTASIE